MGFGQEMDDCGKFMKYSMFAVNFLILVGGIVVLSVGLYTVVDKAFMEQLLGTNLYMSAAYILIGTGVMVVLVAFLGCLGAIKEVKCMLLTYFLVLLLIFVVLMVGGILAYVYRGRVRETMDKEMRASISRYKTDGLVTRAWDDTQKLLMCCGIIFYKDWFNVKIGDVNVAGNIVPKSCCIQLPNKEYAACENNPTNDTAYPTGCLSKGEEFAKQHAAVVGAAGIVVACLMILGMVFSCALFKMIE